MVNDFEEGFENIRSWMDTVEGNLQRHFSTQQSISVSELLDQNILRYSFSEF